MAISDKQSPGFLVPGMALMVMIFWGLKQQKWG
jgi:hypothetical protein